MTIILNGKNETIKKLIIEKLKNTLNKQTFHLLEYNIIKSNDIVEYNIRQFSEMFVIAQFIHNLSPELHNINTIINKGHLDEIIFRKENGYSGDYVLDIEKQQINKDFWKYTYLITLDTDPELLESHEKSLIFEDNKFIINSIYELDTLIFNLIKNLKILKV